MKRSVVLVTGVAALVAASVLGWSDVRQAREFRRLVAQGDAALGRGQTVAALEAFSGAVALRPGAMLPYLKRGDAYRRQGELAAAERDLRQAQALDPTAPQPLELEGDVLMARADFSGALGPFRAYLALDDRAPRVQYKLGLALYRSGDLAGAADAARRALALDGTRAETHYLLGIAALAQGQASDAGVALRRALELDPASEPTRSALAEVYATLGRTRDEMTQREAVAALDAGRPDGLVSLALAYARHGRPDLAIVTLGRTDERFPGQPAVANALGRVWLERAEADGDPVTVQKALSALERVAGRDDASSETLSLYGRALLLNGDLLLAQTALVKATARLPLDRDAFLRLSIAETRLGHRDAASQALATHAALFAP